MNVYEWLEKVGYKGQSDIPNDDAECWYSNFDNSYITRVGMENSVAHLAKLEITEQLTHGIGFSPKDGKWYGWSHRAIYGFKIGSTCKKGDCHYKGSSVKEEIEHALDFWKNALDFWKYGERHGMKAKQISDTRILVSWKYGNKTLNHSLRQSLTSVEWQMNLGKGEWTAETMEDAKQMAIDFNEGVS